MSVDSHSQLFLFQLRAKEAFFVGKFFQFPLVITKGTNKSSLSFTFTTHNMCPNSYYFCQVSAELSSCDWFKDEQFSVRSFFRFQLRAKEAFLVGKFLQFPLVITKGRTNRHCSLLLLYLRIETLSKYQVIFPGFCLELAQFKWFLICTLKQSD